MKKKFYMKKWIIVFIVILAISVNGCGSGDKKEEIITAKVETITVDNTNNPKAQETRISDLTILDQNIIDYTVENMKRHDNIEDVAIIVDENEKQINIAVVVRSELKEDLAKEAAEDVARNFASSVSSADNTYSAPSHDMIGGIYDTYGLLLYVDDGNKTFDMYGAKIRASQNITW